MSKLEVCVDSVESAIRCYAKSRRLSFHAAVYLLSMDK